jgi:hypothetical protein
MRAGQGRVIEDWLEQVLLLARWMSPLNKTVVSSAKAAFSTRPKPITAFTFAEPKLDPAVEVY